MKEMGAPAFNTSFVGQGTRAPKQPMAYQHGGVHDLGAKMHKAYRI